MIRDVAQALVLLHGFTHTGASWQPVLAGVGERYSALAPDIRGHGAASERVPVTLDAVIGDIAELAPERFALAGYSMGGRIALHVALTLKRRVQGLTLIGASPGIEDPEERRSRRAADELLADEFERLAIGELAERWARTPVLAGQSAELQARVHEDRLRSTPAGLARALRGLGTGALPSLWDRLAELAVPVSLIAGERDDKFTALARRMASAVPRAEVHVVPGAGHAVHLEAPGAVAELLR
jgi:2-succinyl-6-hydroxy-2,4-cyclohexadiene-1-carboxylate synthase